MRTAREALRNHNVICGLEVILMAGLGLQEAAELVIVGDWKLW